VVVFVRLFSATLALIFVAVIGVSDNQSVRAETGLVSKPEITNQSLEDLLNSKVIDPNRQERARAATKMMVEDPDALSKGIHIFRALAKTGDETQILFVASALAGTSKDRALNEVADIAVILKKPDTVAEMFRYLVLANAGPSKAIRRSLATFADSSQPYDVRDAAGLAAGSMAASSDDNKAILSVNSALLKAAKDSLKSKETKIAITCIGAVMNMRTHGDKKVCETLQKHTDKQVLETVKRQCI